MTERPGPKRDLPSKIDWRAPEKRNAFNCRIQDIPSHRCPVRIVPNNSCRCGKTGKDNERRVKKICRLPQAMAPKEQGDGCIDGQWYKKYRTRCLGEQTNGY